MHVQRMHMTLRPITTPTTGDDTMTDAEQVPAVAEFDQVEANKLVAELLDMSFLDDGRITLNHIARARQLRDACVERGIQCGLTSDGCTLITVEDAWNEIVAEFLGLPGGGEKGSWSALTISVDEANRLFEVEKYG